MKQGRFSDLPELYAAPPPPRSAPPLSVMASSQALVPMRRPAPTARDSSYLSVESRHSSRISPRSLSSSTTSFSVPGPPKDHINIGIDFGTTFSGVSWAISGSRDWGIHTVRNWPGEHNAKVPTVLSYGTNGSIQWGYTVAADAEKLSWFKLLLAEEKLPDAVRESKQLKATRKLLQRLGKGVVDVTADYLQKLWNYALIEMRKTIASSMDTMPFRIVLGMPANWPQAAQDKMRKAAAQAGLLNRRNGLLDTDLEFVAEPEAAAVAAFHEGNITHSLRIGDIVVICDAGGGTVDIVTYEVNEVQPSVQLGESVGGDMGLCGSIFLDEGFIKYMDAMIGRDKLAKLPRETYGDLMDIWERKIKRQYQSDTTVIATQIPHAVAKAIDSPLNRLRKGKGSKQLSGDTMTFSSDDIQRIFDPVVSDILKLALKQRNETFKKKSKTPKAILLVGGLGGNQFLYESLCQEFGEGGTEVLQPTGPDVWAAICRGAAIKSMGYDDFNEDQPFPVVTSYVSKAHYGMIFKEPFDESRHTEEDRREYDEAKGMDLAWDQMHWYVKKGDDVSKGDPVEMPWQFEHLDTLNRKSQTITIYECETDIAPTRKTPKVEECATIVIPTPPGGVYTDGAEGQRMRVVRFDLRMSLLGMGKARFATYFDGQIGSQKDVRLKFGSD